MPRKPRRAKPKGAGEGGKRRAATIGWAVLCLVLAGACVATGVSLADWWRAQDQVSGPNPARAAIEVEVLNGCGQSGAALRGAEVLRTLGFDVVQTGNADHFRYLRTEVVDRSGKPAAAQEVARALGGGESKSQVQKGALVDVTVILGSDWSKLPAFAR